MAMKRKKKTTRRSDQVTLETLATTVTVRRLLLYAKELKSVHGENPEYDRALCELIADASDMPMHQCKDRFSKMIGIKKARKKKPQDRELQLTVDIETGASYIRIRKGKVYKTEPVGADKKVNVDLDSHARVLGVEILQ